MHSLSRLDRVELSLIEIELHRIGERNDAGQELDETLRQVRRCDERLSFLQGRASGDAQTRGAR